jgi:hypothetical protein
MYPGKCQAVSFFIIGGGIVWISLWIETRVGPEIPVIDRELRLGPESAVKQCQNR